MGTFYGYAERSLENQVNWAEVGKAVGDTVQEEVRIREEKKQAIDDATRDLINEVGDTVTGLHRGANDTILTYSSNTQDLILERQRLLKAGQISPKDYLTFMQNINDSTDTTFTLAQEYQDFYKVKMDRLNAGESQALEGFTMGQAEGFANLENHALVPDPVTGLVVAYETEIVDGVRRPIKGTGRSVNTIKNYITQDFNKYDVSGAVQDAVGGLGDASVTYLEAASQAGNLNILATISDPSMSGLTDDKLEAFIKDNFGKKLSESEKKYLEEISSNYNKWETDTIASMTSFDYNSTSILTENIGTTDKGLAYTYTYDAKEAAENENLILLTEAKDQSGRPVPDFSTENGKKQKERIEAYLRNQIRSSLDRSIERKSAGAKAYDPDYSARAQFGRGGAKKSKNFIANISKLYDGTADEIDTAIKFLEGLSLGKKRFVRTDTGVLISELDEKGKTVSQVNYEFGEGESRKNITDFVTSIYNAAIPAGSRTEDVDSAIERGGIEDKNAALTTGFGTLESGRQFRAPTGDVKTESLKVFTQGLPEADELAVIAADNSATKESKITSYLARFPKGQGLVADAVGSVVTISRPGAKKGEASTTIGVVDLSQRNIKEQLRNIAEAIYNQQEDQSAYVQYSGVKMGVGGGGASKYNKEQ